jgi:hypothetical protein
MNNWLDEDLWASFRDDFKDFTREHFAQLTKVQVFELRRVLLCGGVYVPNFSINNHADAFMQTKEEAEQHTWTVENVDELVAKYSTGAVRSRRLVLYSTIAKLQSSLRVLTVSKDLEAFAKLVGILRTTSW